ncbi:hypothetical protein ABH930_006372 [Kitasatospora sp. GAS204A]|uniref:hypothetical protein n=1 Tax=unclassified Kitasatospora TaxID=2633591 RepID=UPI0024741E39|nr:hypothetical protein [Kitasatospora sp. GAS204B]MDH6122036.1 hypothetical protein [Kitasatospora sp. GAS204B]
MIQTLNLRELPRLTSRQPSGAHPTAGTTLAHPGAPYPVQPPEKDLSTNHGRPKGAAATPEQHPSDWPVPRSHAARTALLTETHPDANETRARFHIVLGTVRAMLEEQPSDRAARAAGRRICAAVTALADDVAKAKREAA